MVRVCGCVRRRACYATGLVKGSNPDDDGAKAEERREHRIV